MGMGYEDKENQVTNRTVVMSLQHLSQSEALEPDYLGSNPTPLFTRCWLPPMPQLPIIKWK